MQFFIKKIIGKFYPFNGVRVPVVLQFSETECGIAALAMIFAYYHFNVAMDELRKECGTSRDGCRISRLIAVAKHYGFEADAYKVELDAIRSLNQPVIAFWNFNHYVVINGVGTDKVFINDPAYGAISVTWEEFDKAFTGIILVISVSNVSPKNNKAPFILPLFKEWLGATSKELVFILMCLLITISIPLVNSGISNLFTDYCLINNNKSWIGYFSFFTMTMFFMLISATVLQRRGHFKICTNISLQKASNVLGHALQLPMLFYSLRQKSEIIATLTRVEIVTNGLSKNIVLFFISLIAALISFVLMLKIDIVLTAIFIASASIFYLFIFVLTKINFSYEKNKLNASGRLYAHTLSTIRNIETVKAGGLEDLSWRKWYRLFCQQLFVQEKTQVISLIITLLSKFCASLALYIIFCGGSFRVASGFISVGNLMAYYALQQFFTSNVNSLLQAVKEMQTAYASHLRIIDILKYEKDNRFLRYDNAFILDDRNEQIISANKLCFFYNNTMPPVLNDINFTVRPGEHIALVGSTGSGKSTLAKIICALFSPHSGEISLGSCKLTDFSPSQLADHFAYLSQEVSLFSGTIYQNLTLWNESIPLSVIHAAIQQVGLSEFVAEKGLYGHVEESGNNFSGGERQRLDIARALIQGASILVLDEATSALDVNAEQKLIDNLRASNKTIIFVAHRLSTIRHCDQIWMMVNGSIVECGNHQQLMNAQGYYYDLLACESSLL
jgi:ABC-type bacteriocin/lantibiotic exporter with double-glycine peptidase domain